MLDHLHHPIVAFPVIVALGIFAQLIASRLRIPAILPLLLIGFALGPLGHVIEPGNILTAKGVSLMTSLAIALILFEGGLTLRFTDVSGHGRAVTRLISWGAIITWVLGAAAAHFITGLSWGVAALFGALIIVTGPTVIAPLLRNIRPNARVGSVLRWEGILIDPIGALAAAIAFEWVRSDTTGAALTATLTHVGAFIGYGTALGLLMGGLAALALRREWLPEHLINPSVLAWVLLAFGLSDIFAPESGLLTVTIMGVMLANAGLKQLESILHFKEEIVVILLSTIFVALAANIHTEALLGVFRPAPLLLLAAVVLLVRPASVLLSTWGTPLSLKERLFISYVGPRGIVAAAISALFATRLQELGVPGAEALVTLVFAIIVGTVVLASLTAKPVARLLQITEADPDGYLIVGAHPLGRDLAQALKSEGVEVMLADTNVGNVQQAKAAGLDAYYGSLLSANAEDLSLEGIGNLLALTSNDEANALSARKYQREFGKDHVYQLLPDRQSERTQLDAKERAQIAFAGSPTYTDLQERYRAGDRIKTTALTETYTLMDFEREQPDALILFWGKEGRFKVSGRDMPQSGVKVISLGERSGMTLV